MDSIIWYVCYGKSDVMPGCNHVSVRKAMSILHWLKVTCNSSSFWQNAPLRLAFKTVGNIILLVPLDLIWLMDDCNVIDCELISVESGGVVSLSTGITSSCSDNNDWKLGGESNSILLFNESCTMSDDRLEASNNCRVPSAMEVICSAASNDWSVTSGDCTVYVDDDTNSMLLFMFTSVPFSHWVTWTGVEQWSWEKPRIVKVFFHKHWARYRRRDYPALVPRQQEHLGLWQPARRTAKHEDCRCNKLSFSVGGRRKNSSRLV